MRYPLLTTSALLVGILLVAACKDDTATVPMVKAPPGITGPTTAEVQASADSEAKTDSADYEEIPPLGPAVAATTPDGITWEKHTSGLCIQELKAGSGSYPKIGQTVSVKYIGTIPSTGKVFDRSPEGKPFEFVFGKIRGPGTVIKGWQLAVSTMRVGGKRKVLIPPDLAYGNHGSLPVIGPNQALIFDLELVAIKGEPIQLQPAATRTGIPEIDNINKALIGPTTAP